MLSQMVLEQYVPIDVSGVHADHRMVHQQVDVELGDADSLGNRAVGLMSKARIRLPSVSGCGGCAIWAGS
jgi:hypothetical protein